MVKNRPQPSAVEAVLVMDLRGSTGMASSFGDRIVVRVKRKLKELGLASAAKNGASFTKWTGDGFLMTFAYCQDAVCAAQDILAAARAYNASSPGQPAFKLRFGINFGDVHAQADGDRIGSTVDLAFRLEGTNTFEMHETREGLTKDQLPEQDRILITHSVYKELSGSPGRFDCVKAGYFDFKGFEGTRIAVYEVLSGR